MAGGGQRVHLNEPRDLGYVLVSLGRVSGNYELETDAESPRPSIYDPKS